MSRVPTSNDYKLLGLEVRPPEVWRYFVRANDEALRSFIENNNLGALDPMGAEDEFVYRNSFALNKKYYASLGEKKAFVVSHGKNMMVLKIVGYAENVLEYTCLRTLRHMFGLAIKGTQRRAKSGILEDPIRLLGYMMPSFITEISQTTTQ